MEERVTVNGGNGGSTYQSKTYHCHLELYFSDKSIEPLMSNGLGKSKKEARKVGIRLLATLLIQSGLIKLGLKDKSFLKTAIYKNSQSGQQPVPGVNPALSSEENRFADPSKLLSNPPDKVDFSLEERNKRLKKEIKRLSKRMQDALKDDNFVEACQFFCQIICNKSPEWNEVAQIWGYAIHKKDIKYIRIILDLIQYKRTNKEMGEDFEEIQAQKLRESGNNGAGISQREEIQGMLKSMYGFGRIRCQNPYDIVV
jgi:hypothetical protein